MKAFKTWFGKLSPKGKRLVVVGGFASVIVLIVSVSVIATDDSGKQGAKRPGVGGNDGGVPNLLGGGNSRALGLRGVSEELRSTQGQTDEMAKQLAQLSKELEDLKKSREEAARNGDSRGMPGAPGRVDADKVLDGLMEGIEAESSRIPVSSPSAPARSGPPPVRGPGQQAQPAQVPYEPIGKPTIITVKSEVAAASGEGTKPASMPAVYIPTGAMFPGVMLSGLDAPTGRSAQSAPVPVLVRITDDAILPSLRNAGVKEAFILAAGHGDLSSERAYLRAERFSMILEDDRVIDIPIKAYASGSDGAAGLRGRLVSKQGQVVAKAMFAGVADGISRAFGARSTNFGGSDGLPDSDEVVVAGIGGGTSGALDRAAAYFLSQAEAMHPVIEIGAGREVTFTLMQGARLTDVDSED